MDFQKELLKFKEKKFPEEMQENASERNSDSNDINQVENSLKIEIRKSSLILQNKLDNLQKEILNLNLENEELKKQIFRLNRELGKMNNLLFESIDIYMPLNILMKESRDKEIIQLMKKKLEGLLRKNNLEETAKIGEAFNHNYHEILNEELEKKENYIIKEIISQGYIKDGKTIRIAKVVVN
ncbi:Molecular chaperone GrpE (heat shock protein) [Cetobacterium ceti]|uniref:Molecular chaperone GrpE (Heat shock protein) n=1 Tax=Cetobacterium ceti TaxID=180163 RepID=A0A1T4NWF7_9FUSO|nr:nucleotide exchange factor GrpE [Cetobacterium ceti]SJZ83561.1 Molecular chaperone GrpE (heat shock protein) [Cetobacterium ceti]